MALLEWTKKNNCQLIINWFSNFEIITYISYNHFNFQILIVYIYLPHLLYITFLLHLVFCFPKIVFIKDVFRALLSIV